MLERAGTSAIRFHPARRRAEPGTGEDPADRAGTNLVTESDELTLDPAMSPARIVSRQPHDEIPHLGADPRTTRPVRIRPVPLDQTAMPSQQRGRGDDPVLTEVTGQQPGQRGQHRPVRPRGPWATGLSAQHGDLVAQHQQLRRLGGIASGKERKPAEHPNHDQVEQSNSHEPDHAPAQ
jgi:hypothetical protein